MHEKLIALIDVQLDRLMQVRALLDEASIAPEKDAPLIKRKVPPGRATGLPIRSKAHTGRLQLRPAKHSPTAFPFSAAQEQARISDGKPVAGTESVPVPKDNTSHPPVEQSGGAGKPHTLEAVDGEPSAE